MLDIVTETSIANSYNGKTLAERLAGRFYTPDELATDLAEQMIRSLPDKASRAAIFASDPFCGDGRLIMALLSVAAGHDRLARLPWRIELRDREAAAARFACERVLATASTLGVKVAVDVVIGNSFETECRPRFDLVITNPPWELLKPDGREIVHMTAIEADAYRGRLRAASNRLDERFPDARGDGAWGGWGTNLARCGWDMCLQIAKRGGVVGIVLPSTLLGDQSSKAMRKAAFGGNTLVDVAAYPSEARLFARVDQPVVALTMLAKTHRKTPARIRIFDADKMPEVETSAVMTVQAMEPRDWTVPVGFGAGAGALLQRFRGMQALRDLEGLGPKDLWLGRELDETKVVEKTVGGMAYPFIKGRMVGRHQIAEPPTVSVRQELCGSFHSIAQPRAVWRDVSRASQRRRMIGTVIPAGWVAGNSLHVACFRDGNMERTIALHGLLSSLVLELQVRSRLSTGHMSLGIVRQARIPELNSATVRQLSSLAEKAIKAQGGVTSEDALEIAVARIYGMDRDAMVTLLDQFPKLNDADRSRLTAINAWSS